MEGNHPERTHHGETRDASSSFPAEPSTEPAIRIRDLHKSFGSKPVLRGFTLDVHRSELLAIVGGSGSGKSVLLKHLAGLLHADRGEILMDGVDLVTAGKEEIAAIHRKIGYLFQEGGLLNSLTIFDNIALPLREIAHVDEKEIETRVRDRLKKVGVEGAEKKTPSELSGGMRKRAGLARAIIEERSFFFFDEPTSALDPLSAGSIRELLRSVHDEWKATSLVVTHDLQLASTIADRIVFLHEGAVRGTGTFEDLTHSDDEIVRDFFQAGGKPGK